MFTALLKKCLDHNVVAICQYIPRKNTPPRFVALIPQVKAYIYIYIYIYSLVYFDVV